MKVILRILPHYLEQNVTQNVQNQIIGKYFIITVWGRKFDSFYNIDKRRQIRFNILPTVYGREFVIKTVNFASPYCTNFEGR